MEVVKLDILLFVLDMFILASFLWVIIVHFTVRHCISVTFHKVILKFYDSCEVLSS